MIDGRRSGAKERYDGKRPVISVRVSEAQKKQAEEMARASGKSVGRLVREGLGLELKDQREAYRSGYDKGRRDAMKECLVTVPCTCGHAFPVIGEDRIREVEQVLMTHCSWYHRGCRPKGVPRTDCRLFKEPSPKKERQKKG